MRNINTDAIIAILFMAMCGVFFKATFDIRDLGYESMGAEVWPRIVLAGLFVVSCIYLISALRNPQQGAKAAGVEEDDGRGWAARFFDRHLNAAYCFGGFILFLLTLDYLGMLIGGVLFVFITLTALGDRSLMDHVRHAGIAVVSIGLMWAIFTFGLRVILPEGEILKIW